MVDRDKFTHVLRVECDHVKSKSYPIRCRIHTSPYSKRDRSEWNPIEIVVEKVITKGLNSEMFSSGNVEYISGSRKTNRDFRCEIGVGMTHKATTLYCYTGKRN